eukprot:1537961-Rhodomonas_salina.1
MYLTPAGSPVTSRPARGLDRAISTCAHVEVATWRDGESCEPTDIDQIANDEELSERENHGDDAPGPETSRRARNVLQCWQRSLENARDALGLVDEGLRCDLVDTALLMLVRCAAELIVSDAQRPCPFLATSFVRFAGSGSDQDDVLDHLRNLSQRGCMQSLQSRTRCKPTTARGDRQKTNTCHRISRAHIPVPS